MDQITTTHSVVKFTVRKAAKKCPVFKTGDFFFVRQHIIDTEVSLVGNFCYHTLSDLYEVYCRVRKSTVGAVEDFSCRDKGMVRFTVERLPDENASIGRKAMPNPVAYPFVLKGGTNG